MYEPDSRSMSIPTPFTATGEKKGKKTVYVWYRRSEEWWWKHPGLGECGCIETASRVISSFTQFGATVKKLEISFDYKACVDVWMKV